MMKDIMSKLANLEATASKTTKKKMLNEDSTTPPMNVSDKPASLKDVFESIAGQKPIPVVGKEGGQQQTGAGFVNVTDPALQGLGKTIGDLAAQKKIQLVVPTQPGQAPQAGTTPAPAGATGQPQAGQMQMKEKWDAETKVAPSEKGKYAGKDKAELTKAYNKLKASGPHKKGSPEFGKMRELAFAIRAKSDWGKVQEESDAEKTAKDTKKTFPNVKHLTKSGNPDWKKHGFKDMPVKEGAKVDRMVKHIEKSERKLGKSKGEAEDIAWATANKRGYLDNKNKKKVKEGDIPSTQGVDTMGAGLGAGRSMTTLEGKKKRYGAEWAAVDAENDLDSFLSGGHDVPKKYRRSQPDKNKGAGRSDEVLEGKKPDFLDLDKDGNKKEPMKKAAADKKKKKVDESMNHRISAARFEGKSHGLKGHAHCGKSYEDLEELKAYHEGYIDGLNECYGMGVYEGLLGTLGGAALGGLVGGPVGAAVGAVGGQELTKDGTPMIEKAPPATVSGMADAAMEDEMDEGNAFTAALAKTPKGGKFSVGGKTFTDTSSLEEYAFESLDKQLNALLNEGEDLSEGLSVSVSKGQQNSPDSVTITAQDAEADQLLQLVKHAGLGLFGDDHAEPSSAMSIQPAHGAPDEVGAGGVDLEVVDGNDGMMGLMQKLSGIQADGASDEDYADEEGGEEHTCNECGMMEAECHCNEEQVEEVQTPDQLEAEVAEDNAPDSGAEDSVADEDAESKEDAALAGEKEEEMNESFLDLLGRLNKLAESKEEDDEEDEEDVTEDAEEDTGDSEGSSEDLTEWANQVGKGPGKGTDASFEQDIDFMTKVIAGGLNKPKSTGQTTVPVIAGQEDRMHDSPKDWATLAGIKK